MIGFTGHAPETPKCLLEANSSLREVLCVAFVFAGGTLERTADFRFSISGGKPGSGVYGTPVIRFASSLNGRKGRQVKLITRDIDYAIRALTYIAGTEHGVASVTDLTRDLKIPRPFLRKILQALNRRGLVKSHKGKGGGFSLIARPGEISVFDLVEIFQGPFRLNEHIFKGKVCPFIRTCYLKERVDEIERHMILELKSIKVASLIRKERKKHGQEKDHKNR